MIRLTGPGAESKLRSWLPVAVTGAPQKKMALSGCTTPSRRASSGLASERRARERAGSGGGGGKGSTVLGTSP
eukprot:CAMPEP_0204539404 /NCGR_PEP_ID=MMETSP0661-20131031/16706_1 /ASSEMBLY_ACC=CAM_ASM_000606 /TAXON_ID=109239 /ORGANISM="Alexandrium margalefi, Strain AMGDE01CS-322" /LENGTH=72 /DNA_ID=CAMNT_0051546011 /DNA_START=112 /DNA_END=327 /DNA_ORIENTATION=+